MSSIIQGILITLVGTYLIYCGITFKAKADSISSIKSRLIITGIIGFFTGLYLVFT